MVTTNRTGTARRTVRKPTVREKQLLDMAEKLAEENSRLQLERSALYAERRRHIEAMAGAPKGHDIKSLDARMDRLRALMGEPVFTPEPGKFGGFTESDLRRIDRARRQAAAGRKVTR